MKSFALGFLALLAMGCTGEVPSRPTGDDLSEMYGLWEGFSMTSVLVNELDRASIRYMSIELSPADIDYTYDFGQNTLTTLDYLAADSIGFTVPILPDSTELICTGYRVGNYMIGECKPSWDTSFVNLWRLTKTREP